MKYITLAIFVSLCVALPASACGFHNSYDVPYGNNWTITTYDDSYPEDMLQSEDAKLIEKEKPVFSTAATRASDLAKARVTKAIAQSKSDTKETLSEDEVSDEKETDTSTDQQVSLSQ